MQTRFTAAQRADPDIADAEKILRTCVHCGFCTATCPTYVLLGDELDSPRGRIYMIKSMLEEGRPADARTVKHVDRCLSCLSCYWVFSIYNLYRRLNPYFPYFDQEGSVVNGDLKVETRQVSLFPILPSVTWNFKF